jgi:PAS domain S-box-containing protein
LFTAGSLERAVEAALEALGQSTRVDRISFFENIEDAPVDDPGCVLRHEWRSSDADTRKVSVGQRLSYRQLGIDRGLLLGHMVSDLPAQGSEQQTREEYRAALTVPILTDDRLRGLLRLEACRTRNPWTAEEIDLVGAVGQAILAAVEKRREEDRLRVSEELHRNLMDSLPEIVFITDYSSRMLYANPALSLQTGYSANDFQMPQEENPFIHPHDAARVARFISDFIAGDKNRSGAIENRFIDKWGRTHWYSSVISKVRFAGQPALQFITHDITDRKLAAQTLRESEERYRSFVEQSSEGIYRVELDRPIPTHLPPQQQIDLLLEHSYLAECNAVMAQMYGFASIGEAVGTPIKRLLLPDDPHNLSYLMQFIMNGHRIVDWESHEVDRDGRPKFFLNNAVGVVENGLLLRVWGTQRDISLMKEVERARRESETKFRAVAETTASAIFIYQGTRFRYVNPSTELLTGYTKEELMAGDFWDVVHPEYRELIKQRGLARQRGESVQSRYEFKIVRKAGEVRWIDFTSGLIEYEGQPAALGTAFDITERKLAEEALRESRANLLAVLENTEDSIWSVDREYRIIIVNTPFVRNYELAYGIRLEIGSHALDIVPDEWRPIWKQRYDRVLRQGQSFSVIDHYEFAGMAKDFEISFYPILSESGEVTGASAFSKEITERKKAADAVARSERYFRSLIENALDIITILNPDATIRYESPSIEKVLGYRPDELVGKSVFDFAHPDEKEDLVRTFAAGSRGVRKVVNEEFRFRHRNGTWRTLEVCGHNMLNDPAVSGIVVNARDVTERKRDQQELAAEKERLAVTLNSIGDGVITTDTTGSVLLMNPVAEKLTGWTHRDARGHPIREVFRIMDERTGSAMESPVERVLRSGSIVHLSGRTVLVARDGTRKLLADSGAPIRGKDHRIIGVVLVFRDVTEKQKMEEERIKASKLESLGTLAGGIAHDFNNILTAILSNLSYVRAAAELETHIVTRLAESEKACIRAKALTQQLLTFSKGGVPIKEVFRVDELIREAADFSVRGSRARCVYDLPADLRTVEADRGQLAQVIQNVVLNAVQAMRDGGTIWIGAENFTATQSPPAAVPPGDYVEIRIRDEGIGILPENIPKIFDPYFTTKDKGTGLGLATSYSILTNHGGVILVDSTVGVGTTFSIYIPSTGKAVEKAVEQASPAEDSCGRILILDDERAIGEVTCDLLQHFGYQTRYVTDGADAIRDYAAALESEEKFDVVIMDLTIPGGLGGKEAVTEILRIDPAARVIVSSGYSNDPVLSDYRKYGFSGYLVKPYETHHLVSLIRKVLDQR